MKPASHMSVLECHAEIASIERQIAQEETGLAAREAQLRRELIEQTGDAQWTRNKAVELAGLKILRELMPERHEPLKIRVFELKQRLENATN